MSDLRHDQQVGGAPIHVGDCYVWAEIYYLDSPTDYSECLPMKGSQDDHAADDLVLLDDETWPGWIISCVGTIMASLICTFLLVLLRYWSWQ
jgi:hypothetical protein